LLEELIEADPGMLGRPLLLIGRQVPTTHGKIIDLLGMDDYGSWVQNLTNEQIREIHTVYAHHRGLPEQLDEAFARRFGSSPPDAGSGSGAKGGATRSLAASALTSTTAGNRFACTPVPPGRRGCGTGAAARGLFDTYGPVGGLDDGGIALGAERGEGFVERGPADENRWCQLPQAEADELSVGGEFGDEGGVFAVDHAGRGGDSHTAVAAGGVVDQVRQRLREGTYGDGGQVGRDRVGCTAGVQGAADGARAEPPH